MSEFFHSVTLDRDLCRGCINCVKRCPTEAIRVRDGKAKILSDRCIDCGECIRICPYHAKKPIVDPLSVMDQYEYTVALPAPSLYGQFNNLDDVEIILRALIDMGFDDIFEVSRAAELVSDATRKMLSEGQLPRPVISSACPAVVRLIRVRFPDLIRHILHFLELGGEDIIALGSDFDGADLPDYLKGVENMENFRESLIQAGISDKITQKIFFDKKLNFAGNVGQITKHDLSHSAF